MKNFEKVAILVVDDNDQVRSLLTSVLKNLGVGTVYKAKEGGDAIELIKSLPQDYTKKGGCPIDLIISDWVMSPVDGISLLRWVRHHPDTPNPFLPFAMISALSDASKIERARDLGATHFFAKPFSVESITAHLCSILTTGRVFVRTENFFGPDRRRRNITTGRQTDRRKGSAADRKPDAEKTEEEKAADAKRKEIVKKQEEAKKVDRFFVPSIIKDKSKENYAPDENCELVDEYIMKKVKDDLEDQEQEFLKACAKYIKSLDLDSSAALELELSRRRPNFSRINAIAHELRGLGGIFEYQLIAIVAQSLYDLTSIYDLSDECLTLVRDHINTFKAIARDNIKGMGGEVGRELIDTLESANRRFLDNNRKTIGA